VPDRWGRVADVHLGFNTIEEYQALSPYFGATIGRFANRIAKGQFTLDGKQYQIPVNNASTRCNGGPIALTRRSGRPR